MTFGKIYVLSSHSSSKKEKRWLVQCKDCDKVYDLSTSKVKKNISGCAACTRANMPRGIESGSWAGGKYIPGIFLSNVKRSARKRSIPCDLTIEELDLIWSLQEGSCAYTGRKLSLNPATSTASLDRVNSALGYTATNVQFTHKDVNIAKWAMKEDYFLNMIEEIYEHRVKNGKGLHEDTMSELSTN